MAVNRLFRSEIDGLRGVPVKTRDVRAALLAVVLAAASILPALASRFEEDFTGAAMLLRLGVISSSVSEELAVESLRVEGRWPGRRSRLDRQANLGTHRFEVIDLESERVLFSHSFGSSSRSKEPLEPSLFLRFPEPKRPFQIRLSKRDGQQGFREAWRGAFDPASSIVDRTPVSAPKAWTLFAHGSSVNKIDLLFLGDAYASGEMPRFHADVGRLAEEIFSREPFASRRVDFNVHAADISSEAPQGEQSPVRISKLGVAFSPGTQATERLTVEESQWRALAAAAPYDFVIVVVNSRRTAGSGDYNRYASVAARSPFSASLLARAMGKLIGGLADEEKQMQERPAASPSHEPWEPNLTLETDRARLKWRALLDEQIPLPTPWKREEYQRQADELEAALNRPSASRSAPGTGGDRLKTAWDSITALLSSDRHFGKVGAFQGPGGSPSGFYRPSVDCAMFTRSGAAFCKVCRGEIERAIRRLTR